MIIVILSLLLFFVGSVIWIVVNYYQNKGKTFFLPQPIESAHFGIIDDANNDNFTIDSYLVAPDNVTNLENFYLLSVIGNSAESRNINDKDIVLVNNNSEYRENYIAIIKYKGKLKARRLGSKNGDTWLTHCDREQDKQHQEKDFLGVVAQVYKPQENKWLELKVS